MPEGDALHRAARRLQVLVGQQLEVETPHPRAAVKQLAPRLDGRRLENVEAIGKNLLLRFEGGLVLRSHLRMKGRWRVFRRDTPIFGQPWLVPRGDGSPRSPTTSCAPRSKRRPASCAAASKASRDTRRCTAARGVPVRAAVPKSAPGRRVTTLAWPTGAPGARKERNRRRRKRSC